jgi:putative tryptophan/tyrosine transport system substrate-binding protein
MQFVQLKRREFISLLGTAAAVWPRASRAQQPAPVIGMLAVTSPEANTIRLRAFREALGAAGYVQGQNVEIKYRWAEAHTGRLPELAAELVQDQVAVLVAAGGTASALAAKGATTSIPIVFGIGADPVQIGLVASLNRPGGNATGATSINIELGPKRLEVMHELLPSASVMALLVNPMMPALAEPTTRMSQAAAAAFGLELHVLHARSEDDFDSVFEKLIEQQASALIIAPDQLFTSQSKQLAELTVRHALPGIYEFRQFVSAGGLISYGSSETEYYRLVGSYVGRILKGDKPADLPVQQSTKVELIINLKAAKALGITFPLSLLGRADEVIE